MKQLGIVCALAGLLAGCQTSGSTTDYMANSRVRLKGVCEDIPIRTSAPIKPPRDIDCWVQTPDADIYGQKFKVMFRDIEGDWAAKVAFWETRWRTYLGAVTTWQGLERNWPALRSDARKKSGTTSYEYGNRSFGVVQFNLERKGREMDCSGFVGFGDYKGAGYEKRLDGYFCTKHGASPDVFVTFMKNMNIAELLN